MVHWANAGSQLNASGHRAFFLLDHDAFAQPDLASRRRRRRDLIA
jgi:hypothetical protein